ncbi:MAG: class I SAM-dependent methyltransferase [Polyangia bacterium]|jgi:16S rRNA (guanine527-N7)-methyltransferase|nr:class I SAM-dependent methyltransferase [Polyangia bacterium]
MGVSLAGAQCNRLASFLELVARWNPRVRLVGSAEPSSLVGVHLADSLALARAMTQAASESTCMELLDVGSGAGFPGFALALILTASKISLCEISEKKLAFLYEAERRLGAGVQILPIRAEELAEKGKRFPQVTSRATFSPMEWRAIGTRLCEAGGRIWSFWSREQEVPFMEESLVRFRYELADGRYRVIAGFQVPDK